MTSSRRLALRLCALVDSFAFLTLGQLSPAQAASIVLKETGSTLLYPLFQMWIRDYPGVAPGVTLTAAATGSGEGVRQAIPGQVEIGASDAYMSDERAEQNPEIKNIPLVISAQTVNYNVTGLNGAGLKLDGPTLAGVYTGRISEWDVDQIKAMNPGVNLPHQTIVPIRREDASGDTLSSPNFSIFRRRAGRTRSVMAPASTGLPYPANSKPPVMRAWSRRWPRRPIRLPISASAFATRSPRPGSAR